MDKSLHQQLYGGMARGSPASANFGHRGGMSMPATGMSDALKMTQNNSSFGMGSSASSLKKNFLSNSHFSLSSRSNRSILGIRSDYSTVENYGAPMPVSINEVLTFKDGTHVSANISNSGWAWVVHGRSLLIWQYKETTSQTASEISLGNAKASNLRLVQCRELTLPHSDIGHKAKLVSVFKTAGQQTASCIAVSATGDARYWISITSDSSSVDATNILDGQEFDKLLDLPQQQGYLLVTTTCNLVFLQVRLQKGHYVLHHQAVKQPSSFLSGFGKKFASILIGVNNSNEREHSFVSMVCEDTSNSTSVVAVLSDRSIQRWRFSNKAKSEEFLYEDTDIIRKIRDEFKQKVWNLRMPADSFDIDLHLLDMHAMKEKFYVLAGAVNASHTPQMYYSLVVLSAKETNIELDSFIPLKLSKFYGSTSEQECLGIRFILSRTHIFLYTAKVVYPAQLMQLSSTTDLEAEKVEFHRHDDSILSAAVCANIPLIFSSRHGLISIAPGDFDSNDFLNMSVSNSFDVYSPVYADSSMSMIADSNEQNLNMFQMDPDDLYNEFQDEVSHLKAAFIYRLKNNTKMATTVINNLLQSIKEKEAAGVNLENENYIKELDKIVITIAEDLAEDIPYADPRWEEAWGEEKSGYKHALGSSRSVQILTQLKDKTLALRHFIDFLHDTGLWEKLNAVHYHGGSILKPTCYVLSDLIEKIVAAVELRTLQSSSVQNSKSKVIEETIAHTVSQWQKSEQAPNLTPQDIFYVRLCKFQDIFEALADAAAARISEQHHSNVTIAHNIYEINAVILDVLKQVFKYREKHTSIFMLPSEKLDSYEYLPWTAMAGSLGIRDPLSRLIDISVRHGAHCTHEVELRQSLFKQILELIDIILDGRKSYLESVRDKEKFKVLQQQFESQRRDLISVLIDNKQYEFATKLGEKYLDFQCLVLICNATDNQDRLNSYIKKYEQFNFSQFAINWHLRQNRRGEVFERFKDNPTALAQFMRDHPTLGWIQLVFNGEFERGANVLFQLAQCETEFVQRKKSMLSLAKLAALAAPDSDLTSQMENINTELTILEYQESMGENILQAFGYDVKQQKVLKVEELINLFIAEENDTATEFEFRKALELLNYMEEPYDARHKIWCAAILRDDWLKYDANNAMSHIQNLLFFKLIELCHLMDGECDSFLPSIDDFLHTSELSDLTQNKSFQYLLKLTYEYVSDAFRKNEPMES